MRELIKNLREIQTVLVEQKGMKIEMIRVKDIPERAKAIGMPRDRFDSLARGMKKGNITPIIMDRESGQVLDGHHRSFIAEELGIEKLPVIYINKNEYSREEFETFIEKLNKEYIQEATETYQRTIACDLDGTLAEYDEWQGHENIGVPIQKTVDALKKEKESGSHVIIHTARIRDAEIHEDDDVNITTRLGYIENWLKENDVPYDEIWQSIGKPVADEYWDDRAVVKP